ncbi:putative aldouronate transport system permease protein [Paenibacillus phyllosphaerae]|uniref:Putative aldouronate transport system permease protein n=1 Tax=Paenibacillus phyllosphaerae TaxID=274593 RepID=A0A7W5AYZ2_9BACL|nr:carbohydrate ABC transporter permease [Paenibacillus phyllosphaerae]MBB3111349.1 putative aldouronate transport system permease protein [Paenibacillus phyllosphaerae]
MKSNPVYVFAVHAAFVAMSIAALFPFLLLVAASFTDEQAIIEHGYALIPERFSLDAYAYLFSNSVMIMRSYGITAFITVVGTTLGLLITTLIAYPLSRNILPFRSFISFFVFFTLLFQGGLVPFYLVYTDLLHMKDTIWALLLPNLLTNGFFILLMRSFFSLSIPGEVVESAYVDGANELTIYYRIVMPLALPGLATIGLMLLISYWNDWYNGLIFINDGTLFSIQNLLNRMLADVQYLQQNNLSGQAAAATSVPISTVRMAIAVIGVLPLIAAYPFFQKYFVKGLTIGAVKG